MKADCRILLLALPLFALVSCEEKTPTEKAADKVGDAVEEIGDAVEDATD